MRSLGNTAADSPAGEARLAATARKLLRTAAGDAVPAQSAGRPSGATLGACPDHVEAVGQHIKDRLRLLAGAARVQSSWHCSTINP